VAQNWNYVATFGYNLQQQFEKNCKTAYQVYGKAHLHPYVHHNVL
jgi:hypothetical protein